MRILLVRHAESEGNVNERAYVEKGDHKVEITEKGWGQAFALGAFLRDYYQRTGTQRWPRMYISPYMRPKQTMSGAMAGGLSGLFPGDPKVREDLRLMEKHYGAQNVLEFLEGDEQTKWLAGMLRQIYDRTADVDPYTSRRLFGDSSKDTMMSVKSLIDGTLRNDMEGIPGVQEPCEDFILWVHGAVIKDFLMSWFHLPMAARDDVPSPGNCDVVVIEGSRGNWKPAMRIWDGENKKEDSRLILEGIKPFTVKDLPPLPEQFLR
jgi:broad specificity phosphatase PhoE